MDFVQNVQNGKTRVLTFGNEYAKMQPTHLGFIVMASFLLTRLLSRFDYVHLRGCGLVWRRHYFTESRQSYI